MLFEVRLKKTFIFCINMNMENLLFSSKLNGMLNVRKVTALEY